MYPNIPHSAVALPPDGYIQWAMLLKTLKERTTLHHSPTTRVNLCPDISLPRKSPLADYSNVKYTVDKQSVPANTDTPGYTGALPW